MKKIGVIVSLLFVLSLMPKPGVTDGVSEMLSAAKGFLSTLNKAQMDKAVYAMDDEERMNWHFIPKERNGLPIKEMSTEQRLGAYALLSSGLSHLGYIKAMAIMSLEQVLHQLENNAPHRNPELYYFTIFGKPEKGGTWGWRVEGHHLSVNFTVLQDQIVATTPLFFGANPHAVKQGPRQGTRVLGKEENLARQLVKSLNEEQRKKTIINTEAPRDIFTSADRRVKPLEEAGLPLSEMNEEQKESLKQIGEEYIHRVRPEFAEKDLQRIHDAGIENIRFAWAGGTEPGEGHYYRIQGPTFLLEYDNVQNGNNHSHTVWRDFDGDFGEDLLAKHYKESPDHVEN